MKEIGTDQDAFEAFYREHLNFVQKFVARRVEDAHTAADLTADIFLAAIESAHRYDGTKGSEGAWLARRSEPPSSVWPMIRAAGAPATRSVDDAWTALLDHRSPEASPRQ